MASATQRKREVLAGIRAAKAAERTLDTALEKVERELLRLRARKTLIQADDMNKLAQYWNSGVRPAFNTCEKAMADAVSIASI